MKSETWFETNKDGLNKQAKERGSAFILVELISNSLDEIQSGVTEINISVEPVPNKSFVNVVVEDNSPRGYGDYLHHAYTLFAESYKRNNPLQSGQFNFGCKLWLSLCKNAKISTTTGTIEFTEKGRNINFKLKRPIGTRVEGLMEMKREEFFELKNMISKLLLPENVKLIFNGEIIPSKKPIKTFEAVLPTKIVDEEGVMRPTLRKTTVSLYDSTNETPTIYELGIPVVETDIRWHVRVGQKVPLNKDRDNVTPAYHRTLRTVVAEHMADKINEEDSNGWCNDVLEDSNSSKEIREIIVKNKFGENAASFDIKDIEANIRWQAEYDGTIVHGRNLTKKQWENIRQYELLTPAGKLAPTPKPWSDDPNAKPADFYNEDELTDGMKNIRSYIEFIADEALGINVSIRFAKEMGTSACYKKMGKFSGLMEFNVKNLGIKWFDKINTNVDSLIIHEFAHHYVSSHHNREICPEVRTGMFFDACCYVGSKIKELSLLKTNEFISYQNQ